MASAHPALNFAAIALYVAVALAGCAAAQQGIEQRRPRDESMRWAGIGLLFVLFALSRHFALEVLIETTLRTKLRLAGDYAVRRDIQSPVAVAALVAFAVVAVLAWRRYNWVAQNRLLSTQRLAEFGVMAMLGLVVVRLISLHALDSLLYGRLRLNWLIDIGATLLVAASALRYIRLVRSRRQRSRPNLDESDRTASQRRTSSRRRHSGD